MSGDALRAPLREVEPLLDHERGGARLTERERSALEWWRWWATRAARSPDEVDSLASRASTWIDALALEGRSTAPMWVIWMIGLSVGEEPSDEERLRRLCGSGSDARGLTDLSLYAEVAIQEALEACRRDWLTPMLTSREGRCVLAKVRALAHQSSQFSYGRERVDDTRLIERLIGLFSAHLLAPLDDAEARLSQHSEDLPLSIDQVTASLISRDPNLWASVTRASPSHITLEALSEEIERVTGSLSQSQQSSALTPRASQSLAVTPPTLITSLSPRSFSYIVNHIERLTNPSRRLDLARHVQALGALGDLYLTRQPPSSWSSEPRERPGARVSATGEITALHHRGKLSEVARSEFLYLGYDITPRIDGFALRWLESETLFYQREEQRLDTAPRAWTWQFHDLMTLAQDHVGLSTLAGAQLVSLWVQRVIERATLNPNASAHQSGRSSAGLTPLTQWSWPELNMTPLGSQARACCEVFSMILERESHLEASTLKALNAALADHSGGITHHDSQVFTGLTVIWTASLELDESLRSHALIINLGDPHRPLIMIPPQLSDSLCCPSELHIDCSRDDSDSDEGARDELFRWMPSVSALLVKLLWSWTMS